MKTEIQNKPLSCDIEYISNSLFQFNCSKVGVNDYEDLVILLKDDDEKIMGGIVGWTRWNWAHIDNLWIDEKYRNQGYGLSLLSLAEKIATERKCNIIDLDTFDFQAPEFYLKNGYEKLFTLDGFGNNNSKIFLKKKLK